MRGILIKKHKKIIIIGSGSFLASYLIDFLKADHELFLFGSKKFEDYDSKEFSYPNKLFELNVLLDSDIVIYTAGAGIQSYLNESSDDIYNLNTFFPIQIINFLISNNYTGKFISFGSYFEIGDENQPKSYNENQIVTSLNPVPNNYCVSKRLLTRFLNSMDEEIIFYHFILPNIYGPRENSNRLIPYLISSVQNNEEIELTSGLQVRQYIHAEDVATNVKYFLENDNPSGIYNLTNPGSIQIKELVKTVFKVLNKEKNFSNDIFGKSHRPDISMPYLLLADDKILKIAGSGKRIDLTQGIKGYLL